MTPHIAHTFNRHIQKESVFSHATGSSGSFFLSLSSINTLTLARNAPTYCNIRRCRTVCVPHSNDAVTITCHLWTQCSVIIRNSVKQKKIVSRYMRGMSAAVVVCLCFVAAAIYCHCCCHCPCRWLLLFFSACQQLTYPVKPWENTRTGRMPSGAVSVAEVSGGASAITWLWMRCRWDPIQVGMDAPKPA